MTEPNAPKPQIEAPVEKPPAEWWPKTYPRLWPLLNSSFGLWFLSSVVVGGLGAVYTHNQNEKNEALKKLEFTQAEDANRRRLIEKLDLEIAFRLSNAISQLAATTDGNERCSTVGAKTGCPSVQRAINSVFRSRTSFPTMFPEFSNHSILALVAELKPLVPIDEQRKLRDVLSDMSGIYTMLLVAGAPLTDPKKVARAIQSKLVLPRWDQGFYYLDCRGDDPFC